jgi:peflin
MAQQPPYGYPPQQGGYPPQQGGYPPQQGGYPPQQGGYPPQQGGYPPQQGAYAQPQQGGYGQMPPPPMGYQQPSALQQWFQAVDQDHSGRISVTELQAALSASGNQFSVGTTEKLLLMFDRDRSGEIGFNEFAQLHQFITTMQQGFRQRDRSGDGRLDGAEVRAALADSGYQLAEGTFQTMMRKFDRKRQGSLSFDDYVELSIFISTTRNVFGFYDRQRTGQITFNFDSFLAANIATH